MGIQHSGEKLIERKKEGKTETSRLMSRGVQPLGNRSEESLNILPRLAGRLKIEHALEVVGGVVFDAVLRHAPLRALGQQILLCAAQEDAAVWLLSLDLVNPVLDLLKALPFCQICWG